MTERMRNCAEPGEGGSRGVSQELLAGDDPRLRVADGGAESSAVRAAATGPDLGSADPLPLRAQATNCIALPIALASAKRKWMDESEAGFANRCLPMLIANQWGWFLLNDRAIRVMWNGGPRLQDLQIQYRVSNLQEPIRPEMLLAVSHFGHGILTFRIPYLFQTPPDWNLYVRGPANWCKDGICPLDGVVEADWSSATFTMNWKVTRPETWIAFEEGEPICQIFPIQRGSVERFEPEILALSQNPELERKHQEWARSRAQFNAALRRGAGKGDVPSPEANEHWQKHYLRGMSVLGDIFPGHQTKLAVREFRDRRQEQRPVGAGLVPAPGSRPSSATPITQGAHERAIRLRPAAAGFGGQARVIPTGALTSAPACEGAGVRVAPDAALEPAQAGMPVLPDPGPAQPGVAVLPGADFKVVVSSENNSYMAWQTQLFCFSAITRLKKHPTVVVHSDGRLLPEFGLIASWRCKIIEAPPFRNHPKRDYPARNELGSLLTISELPEFGQGHILFCEPDMLFANRPAYSGELSGEYYNYLDYNEPRVQAVARKLGIAASAEELNGASRIGVPYLIPGPLIGRLAHRWIEVLDSFEELDWIDIMYAFGLALAAEDLPIQATDHMTDNGNHFRPVDSGIIHYCYGDKYWSKRMYWKGGSPLERPPVSVPKQLCGTVLGEIFRQIRQASVCRQYPRLFNDPQFLGSMFP